MQPVAPALIPTSYAQLEETIREVSLWSPEIQVDIVDGVFVPFTSWPYVDGGNVSDLATLSGRCAIEVDLMLMNPEEVVEAYLAAGVTHVVVHLESTTHLDRIIALKEQHNFSLGFSINNDTELSVLTSVIKDADYVQLMGIAHIGSQGQPFDERVIGRIRMLRAQHPGLFISIDGSVNKETLPRLFTAGADRVVSGSAILKALNPKAAYHELMYIAQPTPQDPE